MWGAEVNLAALANRPTESAFAQWVCLNLECEWVSFRHAALCRATGDIARENSWRLIQPFAARRMVCNFFAKSSAPAPGMAISTPSAGLACLNFSA